MITGLDVDELTAVHVLDAATWQQRRQRLQELGALHLSANERDFRKVPGLQVANWLVA